MAKTQKQNFHYKEQTQKLRTEGPGRLYILRGEEDFLRDSYLEELKKLCVEEGTEAFNYRRVPAAQADISELRQAVEAMPFMAERTLTEVRDLDVNKLDGENQEALKALAADIPEWATLVFVFAPGYTPDGRLSVVKALKAAGEDIEFTAPPESELVPWVIRRTEALGKRIDRPTASYLIWVCGERMNTLIPEILKIAGTAKGDSVTRTDIDAVAKRAPETTIFNLTDALGAREYDRAASLLADLLADKDEPPQKQIAMVSEQYRRLYAARVAKDFGKPDDYITGCVPELAGRTYFLTKLKQTAARYSRRELARDVALCVECDFGMKNGGPEPAELMKELLLKLSMNRT